MKRELYRVFFHTALTRGGHDKKTLIRPDAKRHLVLPNEDGGNQVGEFAQGGAVMFTNLLTATQVVWVYGFAGMTKDKLPKKNQTTILVSPAGDVQFEITKTALPATYGGKLFQIQHRSL